MPDRPFDYQNCFGSSVWHEVGDDLMPPTAPKAAVERVRVSVVGGQLAAMLISHGVAPEDVCLLMPSPRRVRQALRRQQVREQNAALAADEKVCDMPWRGCPAHGDSYLRWSRWRGWRCRKDDCGYRLPGPEFNRHCDQPSVVVVALPSAPDVRRRLCVGHLESERELEVEQFLRSIELRDSPAGESDGAGAAA